MYIYIYIYSWYRYIALMVIIMIMCIKEPERGGLAVGSCLLTAAASLLCGLPAALGVASCSAGGVVLRTKD